MRLISLTSLLVLPLALAGCERGAATAPEAPAAQQAAVGPGELQVSAKISEANGECLPQAIKDLGMSAKREGLQWKIAGRFVHGAIAEGGGMTIAVDKGSPLSTFTAVARWEKPVEAPAAAEMETRLLEMTRKVGLFCGQMQTEVSCARRVDGAERPCGKS